MEGMGSRTHLILVPGFGGFDALGQLDYYAGLTPIFRAWAKEVGAGQAVLHYFDNLPTASVATRAERLVRYLIKRAERGEFKEQDRLALVGHSTGGLDILTAVTALDAAMLHPGLVDGAVPQTDARWLAGRIERLVFLSTPLFGTNIADFVRANRCLRWRLVELAARAFRLSSCCGPHLLETGFLRCWARHGANVALAAAESLDEADVTRAIGDAQQEDARDAFADLDRWLSHMNGDFLAIGDLVVRDEAHRQQRVAQLESLMQGGARSLHAFVSVAPRPAAPPERPFEIAPLACVASQLTCCGGDPVWRAAWRACASGPMRPVPWLPPGVHLDPWDNDGIVNSISQFLPSNVGGSTVVPADHGDVIGHHALQPPQPQQGPRPHFAYDLLGSGSGFGPDGMRRLWHEVFDFCVRPAVRRPATTPPSARRKGG